MLRQLAGSSLSEEDLSSIISRVLKESGSPLGIALPTFKSIMCNADLSGMVVQIPVTL